MSELSQGPEWWQASDLKWYPPEQHPEYVAPFRPGRSPVPPPRPADRPPPETATPSTELPPAGWYPDPNGKPGQMYWDGQAWHTPSPAIPATTEPAIGRPPRRTSSGRPIAMIVIAGVVVVLGAAVILPRSPVHRLLFHNNGSSPASAGVAGSSAGTAGLSPGQATAVVDYSAAQTVQAHCITASGSVTIQLGGATGQTGTPIGLTAVLTDGDPPGVTSIDGVINQKTLGYDEDAEDPGERPTATKDGSTYKITGNAIGHDLAGADPKQTMTWPFKLDVNCS